ncbi:MAG: hypothetical protein KA450_01205 [Bacteroidia bacterium]|nr:hypothetical protein [Bacteroidota bacterium]MBP6412034.1 hypothetical protein [Bacteroidia bacterium]
MDIKSTTDILIFIVFFIPGFVMMKTYSLLVARDKSNFSDDFMEAIAFSCLNYAVCSPLILYMHVNVWYIFHPNLFIFVAILVELIIPIVIVTFYIKIINGNWAAKRNILSTNRSAWDEYFSRREGVWVIVTLKNGVKIGGRYTRNSFTSSYPLTDIYISELWKLSKQGGFLSMVPNTNGILILNNEISYLEFIK